ncbi:MAG: hypothetical protein CMN50_07900 [SAR116 cluster bacterium]|nr:hypothetical protein [SAR116 cluster bacterium]
MENKEIKFEELKKSFEASLRLIEENLAEKLSQENQIENFKNDMNKIKNHIEDTEKNLRDLEYLIKTK